MLPRLPRPVLISFTRKGPGQAGGSPGGLAAAARLASSPSRDAQVKLTWKNSGYVQPRRFGISYATSYSRIQGTWCMFAMPSTLRAAAFFGLGLVAIF